MREVSRRAFLQGMSGALAYLTLSNWLRPSLLFAQSYGSGRNVILVNLVGGYDGLTHFPYYDGPCADTLRGVLRPMLQVPQSAVLLPHTQGGLPNRIGCYPAWARLVGDPDAQGLVIPGEANGNLRILKTVGYSTTDPGRSHDFCQNLFSIGKRGSGEADRKGWLAKFMDLLDWQPLQVYGIGSGAKIDLNAEEERPVIVGTLADFNYASRNFGGGSFKRFGGGTNVSTSAALDSSYARSMVRDIMGQQNPAERLPDLLRQADDTVASAVDFIAQANAVQLSGMYQSYGVNYVTTPHNYQGLLPQTLTSFQRNCQDCAKVIIHAANTASLQDKTKVFYLQRGGWDMHSGLRASIGPAIGDVAGGLAGLVADLKAANLWQDTVVYLFTEFARTNYENSSDVNRAGTDHAYANSQLVLGGSVRNGVAGEDPTPLAMTSSNYLVPSLDFRQVIREIFAWAGVSSSILDQVLDEAYPLGSSPQLFV